MEIIREYGKDIRGIRRVAKIVYHNYSWGGAMQDIFYYDEQGPDVNVPTIGRVGREDLLHDRTVVGRRKQVTLALDQLHLLSCL